MNKEEIKSRILVCEIKEREYLEVGNTKTANRYHNELLKWEDLLNQLNPTLLEERNDYKRGYLNLQQEKENLIKYLEDYIDFTRKLKRTDYRIGIYDTLTEILEKVKSGNYESN